MISYKEVLKTIFLFPVIIGVLGNSYLFYNYGFHFITQTRFKHIDRILMHLVLVNAMFLLIRGSLSVIESLGLNYILNDVACKIIVYLQRVYRGLSLCNTCLLSGYQTIVISPNSPKWAVLKARGPRCIVPCCALCWILNLLIDAVLPVYIIGPRNSTNSKERNKLYYCSLDPYAENTLKFQVWKSICDTMFVVLMVITSGYMVYVLYRHHQQVGHIHSTSLTLRASPEIRATKLILMLVTIFFLFNTISFILLTYIAYSQGTDPWLQQIAIIMSVYFQTFSPFVLISSDTRIPQISCGLLQRMKRSSTTTPSTISDQTPKTS